MMGVLNKIVVQCSSFFSFRRTKCCSYRSYSFLNTNIFEFFLDIHANPVYMYRTSQVHVRSLSPYIKYHVYLGLLWPWLYGNWIYNYLCDQCLSPLKLWVRPRSWRGVLDATLCDKVCQWLATGWWFSPGTLVSSTTR